jgi:hypothetical protein
LTSVGGVSIHGLSIVPCRTKATRDIILKNFSSLSFTTPESACIHQVGSNGCSQQQCPDSARATRTYDRLNPADREHEQQGQPGQINGCLRHVICSAADPIIRLAGGTLQCCYANAHAPRQRGSSRPLAKVSAASPAGFACS